ncbi:hypothetical protein [uncultured Tateyamaria sp.]|uniref:hypothetical protein n=1 Tax=uncultured Tateyamaria sp. TaxID=455651 RepID=UPI00260AE576|nr:hypothetical protein [uncultured Tateyamaria sp.]
MAGTFLNLNDNDQEEAPEPTIGAGLKQKKKGSRPRADAEAVAAAGRANGFSRSTDTAQPLPTPRRGRPPLNEDMTYWRIYVSSDLRTQLNALRDKEGRRLNDVLADMLDAYQNGNAK